MSWLMENLATIIITVILFAVVTLIVMNMCKNSKNGSCGCGCGCGCSDCPGGNKCHP